MQLFELKDYNLTFSPQALSLKPFKALWDRDKSKDKKRATAELSYIYFFADYKSDFANILDPEDRTREIVTNLSEIKENWEPDAKVQEALDFYNERQKTITTVLLDNARHAVNELSQFLRNVDLELLDERGKPIYDAKKIADTISNLGRVVDSVNSLEDKVKREKDEAATMRGGRSKGLFEDGL
jgi:hypothetical protein